MGSFCKDNQDRTLRGRRTVWDPKPAAPPMGTPGGADVEPPKSAIILRQTIHTKLMVDRPRSTDEREKLRQELEAVFAGHEGA